MKTRKPTWMEHLQEYKQKYENTPKIPETEDIRKDLEKTIAMLRKQCGFAR